MRVSIMQPAYLPWLGYFHRLMLSDVHVVLDNVPASKGDFSNRNRIRTATGWTWLTVPVAGSRMTTPISELQTDSKQQWQQRHWKTIESAYSRAPYFHAYAARLRDALLLPAPTLESACLNVLNPLLEAFAIATPLIFAKNLDLRERKSDLVLEICSRTNATTYISGPLGRDYLDLRAFANAGIEVEFHDYVHPVYSQIYEGFEPLLSAVDLLFNCGSRARAIIAEGQPPG